MAYHTWELNFIAIIQKMDLKISSSSSGPFLVPASVFPNKILTMKTDLPNRIIEYTQCHPATQFE